MILENINHIRIQIRKTATLWHKNADDITIVAVSKRQPPEKLKAALNAGHRTFGENRVQEAIEHWADHKKTTPDLRLHLIGPLQTNKIKDALSIFDVIETVDREKLARKLGAEMTNFALSLPCLIQVNTGEEDQKSGIKPSELPDFLNFCKSECSLNITGLMCIPPIDDPAALHFAMLEKMAKQHNLKTLSMGMSADYEHAIPHGATHIRIGTAIFGDRV